MKARGIELAIFLLSAQLALTPSAHPQTEITSGPAISWELSESSIKQVLGLEKSDNAFEVELEARVIELSPTARKTLGFCSSYTPDELTKSMKDQPFSQPVDFCAYKPDLLLFNSLDDFSSEFPKHLESLIQDNRARVINSQKISSRHGILAKFNFSHFYPGLYAESDSQKQFSETGYLIQELHLTPFIDIKKNLTTFKINPVTNPLIENYPNPYFVTLPDGTQVEGVICRHTRTFETILRVPNESTIVISGFGTGKKNAESPWFANLPLIDSELSSPEHHPELSETIILLTSRIVPAR